MSSMEKWIFILGLNSRENSIKTTYRTINFLFSKKSAINFFEGDFLFTVTITKYILIVKYA